MNEIVFEGRARRRVTPQGAFPPRRGRPKRFLSRASALAVALLSTATAGQAAERPQLGSIFGVTVTDPWQTEAVIEALGALPRKPTARIVFDEFVAAREYGDIPRRIADVAFTLGALLDSSAFKRYGLNQYKDRVREYVVAFGNDIDVWEIGNEINGEWLGNTRSVVAKLEAAYDVVNANGGTTAMTLYYNRGCWENERNEMFAWARRNIPNRIKSGIDYVYVSYYEDDCRGLQLDWPALFEQLGEVFPKAKLGVGECGTRDAKRKEAYLRRYYTMRIDHPRFVGGYYWWYFSTDMVPVRQPLWNVLRELAEKAER